VLAIEHLVKQFGDLTAVDDVSFSAETGTVFGLLGPNGAGKSTTINCVSGLLSPTSGHIAIAGHDIARDGKAARKSLGIVPQELALYEDLPAIENLCYWGRAYGMKGKELESRVAEVLDYVGLADRAKDLPKTFSGGMKRRPTNRRSASIHNPVHACSTWSRRSATPVRVWCIRRITWKRPSAFAMHSRSLIMAS
jgi:ABC-2 type transport system ATP-binding protein